MRFLSQLFILLTLVGTLQPWVAAYAQETSDSVSVEVIAETVTVVEFDGSSDLIFTLTAGDIHSGTKTIYNQGDLDWASNSPWTVVVQRSSWKRAPPGNPNKWNPSPYDLHLQLKAGPPNETSWKSVYQYPTDWESGAVGGSGTFFGLDWRVIGMGPGNPVPGHYKCTISFTVTPGGS